MVNTLFPLTVTGATARRSGRDLIGPIDLHLSGAPCTMVIGPNGSGKTTLLRLLSGAARLGAGQINWASDSDYLRAAQAFVFQRPVMLRRTVLQNLCYPLQLRGVSRAQARRRAEEWAAKVGLTDLLDRPAPALSGGEQQKLALARALITNPKVLFLDEPCAALDGRAMREVEAILQAAKTAGTRLIMSTHDMGQARRLADEVLFLLHGKLHEHTLAAEFFAAPQTPQAAAFLNGDIVE